MASKKKKRTVSTALLDVPDEPKRVPSSLILEEVVAESKEKKKDEKKLVTEVKPEQSAPSKEAASLEQLAALHAADPEKFAAIMEAAASGSSAENEEKLKELWNNFTIGSHQEQKLKLPGGDSVLEEDGSVRPAEQPSIEVFPVPGYVIKSSADVYTGEEIREIRGSTEKEKYLINVCGSDLLAAPGMIKKLDEHGVECEGMNMPISIGELRREVDNKQTTCIVLDVLINTNLLNEALANKDTRHWLSQFILDRVAQKYAIPLDIENYKLPKLKYKGNPEHNPQRIRDDSKKPKIIEQETPHIPLGPPQVVALGPPPDISIIQKNNTPYKQETDWPIISLGKIPHTLRIELSVPILQKESTPWSTAKVSTNGFLLSVSLNGREPLKVTLPYSVIPEATAHLYEDKEKYCMRLDLRLDDDFEAKVDPGSAPWRLQKALASNADSSDTVKPRAEPTDLNAIHDRYGLSSYQATANTFSGTEAALAAEQHAKQAAELARREEGGVLKDDDSPNDDDEEDILPEDRFHRDDIISQHYISQRKQQEEDRRLRAQEEKKKTAQPEEKKKEENIEYIDLAQVKKELNSEASKKEDAAKKPKGVAIAAASSPPVQPPESVLNKMSADLNLGSSIWAELI